MSEHIERYKHYFHLSPHELKLRNKVVSDLKESGESCSTCKHYFAHYCKLKKKAIQHYYICNFHTKLSMKETL